MKFNLKKFAKEDVQDEHEHNEKRLQKEHQTAPEVITQKQLDRDRVEEKEVTTEKLLEQNRTGGADVIIEKNLDDSKSKLVQHRNTAASDGDINKLEEQRIDNRKKSNAKVNEKAEPASSTPSKMRWWDHLKASGKDKIVTAQTSTQLGDEEGRWERGVGSWSEDEGLAPDRNEQFTLPEDDFSIEEIGGEALTIEDIKPIDTPLASGLYVSFNVNEGAQMGVEELQEAAYNKLLEEGYGYLAGIEGFTPASFVMKGDQMVARLIGDEYLPAGKGGYEAEALPDENPFSVSDLQPTDVEGIVIGTITIDPSMIDMVKDMEGDDIKRKVMDAISVSNEGVSVEDDGIDLDNISNGEISFVGEVSVGQKGRPESYEKVKGDPIASSDFDIVVLSQSIKKN